jgi:hypothetical protein
MENNGEGQKQYSINFEDKKAPVPWDEMCEKTLELKGSVEKDTFHFVSHYDLWAFHEWYMKRLKECEKLKKGHLDLM